MDTSTITGYHAHVYYPDAESRERAAALRQAIETKFDVRMGRWRDEPVGPHPLPMYQVAFDAALFAEIVPWLMLNRNDLIIFVHPETGDDVPDHRDFPLWLGQKLDLNMGFLEAGNRSA
jgi:DOPA 4,5-dioxygenase